MDGWVNRCLYLLYMCMDELSGIVKGFWMGGQIDLKFWWTADYLGWYVVSL